MTLAEVLAALARPGGVSGSELAARFGVTRAAVWKRIAALREAGLEIEALPGRGYRLAAPLDLLDAAAIEAALPAAARMLLSGLRIDTEIDSTSSALQRAAASGAGSGAVWLAESQTAGRGRRGRAWQSPIAANLYLSVLWRFDEGLAALGGLSIAAGVAVADALQGLGLADVALKWPNDLVVGTRKLGGLLIDAAGDWAGPCHAVIGVGLNVRMPAAIGARIDQPWIDLAGALAPHAAPSRSAVAGALLGELLPALARFSRDGLAPFIDGFARHDALRDRPILVHAGEHPWPATALGLAPDGRLRVRDAAGNEHRLAAADVSVRSTIGA
jgi:BirA family biotin operon repressor/biotin-[acetyl-CoA-carboxylase] ligase